MKPKKRKVDPETERVVMEGIYEMARQLDAVTPEQRAAAVAKVRDTRARNLEREAQSMREHAEAIFSTAEQVLKMSRQEILAKAEEIEAAEAAKRPNREIPRSSVLARGVPDLHVRHIFDSKPVDCQALQLVKAFLDADQQVFLVLSGAAGTRKSGSACWALVNHPGRYVSARKLVDWSVSKTEEDRERYANLYKTPLLVLDDLGSEYVDDAGWFAKILTGIVDERYGKELKTIITTNLEAKRFKDSYGERVAERIREIGKFATIAGASQRQRMA